MLAAVRSNRTFMELKSRLYENVLHSFASSNRTFMELKLAFSAIPYALTRF